MNKDQINILEAWGFNRQMSFEGVVWSSPCELSELTIVWVYASKFKKGDFNYDATKGIDFEDFLVWWDKVTEKMKSREFVY